MYTEVVLAHLVVLLAEIPIQVTATIHCKTPYKTFDENNPLVGCTQSYTGTFTSTSVPTLHFLDYVSRLLFNLAIAYFFLQWVESSSWILEVEKFEALYWIYNDTDPYSSLEIGDEVGPGNNFSKDSNATLIYYHHATNGLNTHSPFSVFLGLFNPNNDQYAYFGFSVNNKVGINVTIFAWSDMANESLVIALDCSSPTPTPTPSPTPTPTPTPAPTICSSSDWLKRRFEYREYSLTRSDRHNDIPTFIHLPKTGGTTMLSILRKNAHNQDSGFLNYGMPPFIWTLFQDIERRRGSLEFLGGHFGLSDLQAINELQSQDGQPMQFLPFTIMRNPNERLVSFWAYLKDIRGERNANITEVLSRMLPDSMYRLLSPARSDLDNTTATMEAIKESLRSNFALVGLTERFEETLLLLKRQGIIHDISFRKHKVLAPERPSFEALPLEVQQEIKRQNTLDQQLYDFAKQLLEEKLREQDAGFWVELEEFKAEQRKRFEEFGECEDDEKPFGGWRCHSEARQKVLQARGCKREEAKERVVTAEEEAFLGVDHFFRSVFKPRYW